MLPGMTCTSGGAGGAGGSAEVSFVNRNAYAADITPIDVTASWSTTSAGADSSDSEATRTWLLSGASSAYELLVTVTSGALSTGTAGTWQAMNATLSYTKTRTSNIAGTSVVNLACQVRRASDLVVIATFTVSITAEVTP